MKEYELIANLIIETTPDKRDVITSEIMDAIVEVVERHQSFCGGGIDLKECGDMG